MSTRHLLLGATLFFLPVCLAAATTPISMIPVDLATVANCRVQTNCYASPAGGVPDAPEGSVTLGGVPFNLGPVGGNNGWSYQSPLRLRRSSCKPRRLHLRPNPLPRLLRLPLYCRHRPAPVAANPSNWTLPQSSFEGWRWTARESRWCALTDRL